MGDSGTMALQDTEQINVLVTGFGPFRRTTHNPSWETAKALSQMDARSSNKDQMITIHASYMPAEYDYTASALAYYHGNSDKKFTLPQDVQQDAKIAARDDFCPDRHYDLVLHIGQGQAGGIRLETIAYQLGYRLLDAAKSLASVVDGSTGASDDLAKLPEQYMSNLERNSGLNRGYNLPLDHGLDVADGGPLQTPLDTDALAGVLSKRFPHFQICKSANAGRYICEYTYFGSLAECAIASRRTASALHRKPTRVLFVHVPPEKEPLEISEMAEVLHVLIEEIASGIQS